MAAPITLKCIECLDTHLTLLQQGRATSSSNDVVEACLDLISYLAETLKERYAPTLRTHDIMPSLLKCLVVSERQSFTAPPSFQDQALKRSMPLQQSTFAVIGDLAVSNGYIIQPHLSTIIPAVSLDGASTAGSIYKSLPSQLAQGLMGNVSVCSNASWALGEIIENLGPETMLPYADYIATKLTEIVTHALGNIALRQNACITLVRNDFDQNPVAKTCSIANAGTILWWSAGSNVTHSEPNVDSMVCSDGAFPNTARKTQVLHGCVQRPQTTT